VTEEKNTSTLKITPGKRRYTNREQNENKNAIRRYNTIN
jgi:hypothetical protein